MAPVSRQQVDVARLKADIAAASVELLSAHCAPDHIRLKYSPLDVVAFGERHSLQRAIASAEALYRFFLKSRPTSTARRTEIPKANSRFAPHSAPNKVYEPTYFSTRMNSPVEALTDTVSLAPSRPAP